MIQCSASTAPKQICKTPFLAHIQYLSKQKESKKQQFLPYSFFNDHNQLSTLLKICIWIAKAKAAINLIFKKLQPHCRHNSCRYCIIYSIHIYIYVYWNYYRFIYFISKPFCRRHNVTGFHFLPVFWRVGFVVLWPCQTVAFRRHVGNEQFYTTTSLKSIQLRELLSIDPVTTS